MGNYYLKGMKQEAKIIKSVKKIEIKAKKCAKKYGPPIPLIDFLTSTEQWNCVLDRLDSWGLKIVKKGKKK